MRDRELMIDYRNEKDVFVRRVIDDMEFCVRDGNAYFISDEIKYCIPLEQVVQMYTN